MGALGCLLIWTSGVVGAWPFDLVELHRRQIRCNGTRRVAGDVFAVGLGAVAVWGAVLAIFRIVSLSSILAALTAIALVFSFEQPLPYRLLVIAGGMYVIARHRANIHRPLDGAEPRLEQSGPGSNVGQ